MKRAFLAVIGMVCLLPGILVKGGWAQDGAGQAKRDWSRSVIAVRLVRFADIDTHVPGRSPYSVLPSAIGRVPNLRSFGLTQFSFASAPRPFAVRPLATPATADAWNTISGNWSVAGNWTAGVPTSSSAVTIGNTSSATVTEDLASASAASLSITSSNALSIGAGNTLTVGGATTVSSGADLLVGNSGAGGSTLNSGGSVTNGGYLQVGNYYMTSGSTMNVTGTYTGTGGTVLVDAGNAAGANALLSISGAAPGTLTGTYEVEAYASSAAIKWGSGAIASIGDGASNAGDVLLSGSSAYMETGATNSNSALKSLTTIASNGELQLESGASLTTTGALTVAGGGTLYVDANDNGGSSLTLGGALTSSGYTQVGNYYMSSPSTVKVDGTLTNSGTVLVGAGNAAGANALLNVTGAVASTLTGTYQVDAYGSSAAIEWGSGAIASIGDGVSNAGDVLLSGSLAYMEIGATNSNSALKSLTTIASNGELQLESGASLTTTGALAVNGGGTLGVDAYDNGGSSLTLGGALTSSGYMQVGNYYMSSPSTVKVDGTLTNSGTVLVDAGNAAGANALLNVTGAVASTLTGTYQVDAYGSSAAIEWGSGAIASIGNGTSAGEVVLSGALAYMEIGATNSNSALKSLTTIASDGELELESGASVTTTGALAVNGGGALGVDAYDNGSSTLTIGGALTNGGSTQVGNYYMVSPSNVKVTGTLTNTGTVQVNGGNTAGANALLDITGAAPATLTGIYQVNAAAGSAAIEWGSGAITSIGNGTSSAGEVTLSGTSAYMEIGATNSNSALKTLTTIASNGELQLESGASVTTTGALAVNGGGTLGVDAYDNGGSTLTIGGALTNSGSTQVGNYYMVSPSNVKVTGTLTNTGTVQVNGGNTAGANALLDITGAAPATFTGIYQVNAAAGSAAIEWGSGAITSIGNGASGAGEVTLSGTSAYMEIGATNTNSALKTLATIASNGQLQLESGASVTDTAALTVNSGGILGVDAFDGGGSILRMGGALTNSGSMQIGNYYMTSSSTVEVAKGFTNTSTVAIDAAGANASTANAVLEVTGPTLVNSGAINLNGSLGDAELEINGNVTLSGAGSLNLSNIATNVITGAASTDTLTNSSTIQGSGTFENIGIVNTGTITANQSTPIVFLPSSAGLNNQGTLSVLTGDTMQIGTASGGALTNFSGTTLTGGTYSVGGTLQFGASGASIVTDAANISLTGAGAQMINFGNTSLLTNLATITSAGSLTLGTSWGTFTTTGNFTNDGTLAVGSGDKFIVDLSDSLTNFSGTTLTGGAYKVTGTLQFAGANIVTNDASITLTGAGSKIVNQSGANALANFATNATGSSFTLGKGRSFTTAGNFTNHGYLSIAAGDTFDVNGNLTNFSGATLTGGTYSVSGILEFDGAAIVTNSANITLGSATAKIENQSAANALLGFTTNTSAGKFTLSGNANLTTNGGSFTNAGLFTVSTGSTFTVGGSSYNFTQTAGTTTIDGTLAGASAGALDLNGGNLYGTGTLDYGVVDTATITPGNSATSTGKLQVDGTYAQNTGGALDVTIGGTTAGTKFDQLNVSGTASLNGTLNITLASGYTPAIGNTFDILNASTINGSFSTVNGLAINSSEHFTVTTVSGDEIVLTVVSGAATTNSVSLATPIHPGVMHGRYGREVFSSRRQLATVTAVPRTPPVFAGALPVAGRGIRPRDEFGSDATLAPLGAANAATPSTLGISPVSASAYNSMAAMNHMRFECGVDLKALLKTSRKQMLRGLWASPDSPDAINIGYMALTTR
jgi:hypothetical protein